MAAPDQLPAMLGCVSSVQRAVRLAGDSPALLVGGELRTNADTALLSLNADGSRWGLMWGQVACASLPAAWPLGTTEHEWGNAEGSVTWMIAGGAGEGDGDEVIHIHLPPSQRATWRPLALIHAPTIELYLRDAGCALQYVYKGTQHPTSAPQCADEDGSEHGPRLMRPPMTAWYTPPDDDGQSFRTAETIRWLISYSYSSRAAHSMLIESDAPWASNGFGTGVYTADGRWGAGDPEAWHNPDGMLTTASECIHGRCAASLRSCYLTHECRMSWNRFAANQGRKTRRHPNLVAV
jgi:hypothetical protein